MSDQYLGEIRMFGGNFAPYGWALCNGQTLSISQNSALFSLIGTYYGGDGVTTFQLPNLQSRVAIHQGQGVGLSPYVIGQNGGTENVTLSTQQMPQHNHTVATFNGPGNGQHPSNSLLASTTSATDKPYTSSASDGTTLNTNAVSFAGSSQPHPNIQPYLCVTFIIALQGIYPSRN
ncbi:MAG TPA: tail fiber protein [Bryobacteraceae bacterium]|jgi:microcystin-dependent protein|nr:tail fiber protein [Bryobacteraceae bacterium]